jgi:hypothetical protein
MTGHPLMHLLGKSFYNYFTQTVPLTECVSINHTGDIYLYLVQEVSSFLIDPRHQKYVLVTTNQTWLRQSR